MSFLSGIVVARHLEPSDFGVVAAASLVVGFASLTTGFGFGPSVVAARISGEETLRSVHWLLGGLGVVIGCAVAASATMIARFFGDNRLIAVIPASALAVPLAALTVIPAASVQRDGRFATTARVSLLSQAFASSLAIILALLGAGVWTLVCSALGGILSRAVALWRICRERLLAIPRIALVRGHLLDGSRLLAVDIGDYLFRNADNAIVGRAFGATALGEYSFAYSLFIRPVNLLSGSVGAVLLSRLGSIRGQGPRFDAATVRTAVIVARIAFPALVGGASVSRLAIPLVFGQRWSVAITLIQIFFVLGAIQSVGALAGPVWIAMGRGDLLFRWTLLANVPMFLSFLAGAALGSPEWVAGVSTAFAALVLSPLTVWVTRRFTSLKLPGLEPRLFRVFLDTSVMTALVWLAHILLSRATVSQWLALGLEVLVGAVSYVLLFRFGSAEEFAEMVGLLNHFRTVADD